jgi:signal transduction histidine kinase/ActR/RegA family two-component response regulator
MDFLDQLDSIAVKVISRDAAVRLWSGGSGRLHGILSDNALGADYVDLVVPSATRPLVRQLIQQSIDSRQTPGAFEMRLLRSDGEEISVWSHWSIRDSSRGDSELMIVDVDLTPIVDRFEQMDAKRRRDLGGQKMAMIAELVGGISHHVNNALMVIQGSVDVIRHRHGEDEETAVLVEQVLQTTRQLSQLTGHLLSYEREPYHGATRVDVHRVIRSVAEALAVDLDPSIELRIQLVADQAVVMGDEAELRSAVMCLALNACDAVTDGGAVTVATELTTLDQDICDAYPYTLTPGRYIRITLRDTGVGMDENTLERAYEPFFTTKPFGQGNGLGLANVYGSVKAHHGAMHLSSAPGGGTEAAIFLPLPDQPSPIEAVTPDEAAVPASPSAKEVIIAESEPPLREQLEVMLIEAGFVVQAFGSSVEAIEYCQTHAMAIKAAIVDLGLARPDGRSVLRRLKEISGAIDVFVGGGMLTAGEFQGALDDGAAAVLSKPYQRAQVLSHLERSFGPAS